MITTSHDYKTTRICSLMVTHGCNLNCVYCFEKFKSLGRQRMSFETARSILEKEFADFKKIRKSEKDRFAVEFFGGEPLVNFQLIKDVYYWVKDLQPDFPLMFQTTTNGTLFTKEILDWFTGVKDHFRVVVSIDGDELMHLANRGVSPNKIPLEFIAANWPNSYFKMTVSRDTLPHYAEGVIGLTRNGYHIPSSLAEGIEWNEEDARVYREELLKIGSFFLENPDYKVEQPFTLPFERLLYQSDYPPKNCGVGTNVGIYDTDGKMYPCHLFLPIVHGGEIADSVVSSIDFTKDEQLISPGCLSCPISKLCRTCYGFNLLERGDIKARNLSKCKMQLIEIQVISSFQIQYFLSRENTLKEEDKSKLMAAMKAYEVSHNMSFDFE